MRLNAILILVFGMIIAGLVGYGIGGRSLDEASVRAIVSDQLAKGASTAPQSVAATDASSLDKQIETYLLNDPDILQRMSDRLADIKQVAARQAQKSAIDAAHDAIYDDPDKIVLGNPKGDVTLVEMFDYNCTYCRGALPDLQELMAEDPNLRVILKQFPILSKESVDAARVAVLVSENPKINYWDFHQALFSTRGTVDVGAALTVAAELGASRGELMIDMNGRKPNDVIQRTYDLAKKLNISGTPTYILADETIPGAMGLDQLKAKIANVRSCGSTYCPPPANVPAG